MTVTERSSLPSLLVIDDESSVVSLISQVLTLEGYEVLCGRDGIDAFSHLFTHQPSVTLIDLSLPCMTGLEVIEQVRSDRRMANLPIVAMSGSRELLDKATKLGANDVISKPFGADALLKLLARHVTIQTPAENATPAMSTSSQ